MNRVISYCALFCTTTAVIIISLCAPWVLSDNNKILFIFITQGSFISLLGVIATITLASTANLHLQLNKMEESVKKLVFKKTRRSIMRSSWWLIALLFFAVILLFVKSLLPDVPIAQSLVNGACLLVILVNLLIMIDLTRTIFAITPNIDE